MTITKHGVPVAVLVPVQETHKERVEDIIQEVEELRRRTKKGRESLRKLREEGRRF